MSFHRPLIRAIDGGLAAPARVGAGWLAMLSAGAQSADSNQTITVEKLSGGLYYRSGMTAGRSDTWDTAANIIAAFPSMDIGDTFLVFISNQAAQTLTLLAGTGNTLAGKTTVAASGIGNFLITKTSATTTTITGL